MNQMIETMNEIGRNAFQAARQLNEVNLQTVDRLAEQQVELFSQNLERGLSTVKRLSGAKEYSEILSVQADAAKDLAETTTQETRKAIATLTEARNTVNELLQKELKQAVEKTVKATRPEAA